MGVRCLIVDDNPRFLEAASMMLERGGFSIAGVASTSAEALERAEELRPDLMLVDVDLGADNGLDLAERLAERPTVADSPVIMISAHAEADYADLVAASPAVGFLSKFDLSANAVRRLLATTGRGDRIDTA